MRLSAIVDVGELGNETRMNKEAFEFIVSKNLYSIEGQEEFLTKNLAVDFPVAAKEIKAAWRMFTDAELDPTKTFKDLDGNGRIEDNERGLHLLERTYHVAFTSPPLMMASRAEPTRLVFTSGGPSPGSRREDLAPGMPARSIASTLEIAFGHPQLQRDRNHPRQYTKTTEYGDYRSAKHGQSSSNSCTQSNNG